MTRLLRSTTSFASFNQFDTPYLPCAMNQESVASFPSTSESATLYERYSEQGTKSAPAKIDMPTQEDEGEHNGIERSERWTRELLENFDDPRHLTCPIEARVKSDDDDDQ
jgi:hypothetical protein